MLVTKAQNQLSNILTNIYVTRKKELSGSRFHNKKIRPIQFLGSGGNVQIWI